MSRHKLVTLHSTMHTPLTLTGLHNTRSLLQALQQIHPPLLGIRLQQPSSQERLQLNLVFASCCPCFLFLALPVCKANLREAQVQLSHHTYVRCILSRLGKVSANKLFIILLSGFSLDDQYEETPKCSEMLNKAKSLDPPDQYASLRKDWILLRHLGDFRLEINYELFHLPRFLPPFLQGQLNSVSSASARARRTARLSARRLI